MATLQNQQDLPTGVTQNTTGFGNPSQINNGPGTVSAFNVNKTVDNPVSDTSGIRGQINTFNSNIATLSAPTTPIFGQYNPSQQGQIDAAGNSTAADYNSLIRRAQDEKAQGQARNTVAAGERGGFMNSQFAGIAANTPIKGGNFEGAGGQLERMKSAYDLNIQDLESKKISAITNAKQSMQQYIDAGKQQDFANAQTSYQNARQAQQDQETAQANAQQAQIDAKKANFDLSVPLSEAGTEVQKYAMDQLAKYPDAVSNYIAQGGNAEDLQNMNANQLAAIIAQSPSYIAANKPKVNSQVVKLDNGNTVLIDTDTGKTIRSLGGADNGGTGGGGSVVVGGKEITPGTQKALSVILGSAKFTKDQAKAVTNAINSGEDPFTVVKNQAKNIMSSSVATDLSNLEVAQSSLDNLDKSLKDFYAAGGTTGYFKGNIENVVNKLGQVKDEKLVPLAVQIATAIQKYRHAVSGTAYSAQEGAQIDSVFPGINKTEGLNNAIISGRKQAIASDIDSSYRTALGSAYDELKNGQISTKPTPEPVDRSKGVTWNNNGVTYVSDGSKWVKQK